MKGFDESTYGETIADIYDDWYEASFDVDGAVALLADLANVGPALELGAGTGRIALPLSARGVSVEGIDSSPAMSQKLAEKPGGGDIRVAIGDFSDFDLGRDFSLVYVVFNTLFGLQDQESQVRCFASASRHLRPGGEFVVEAFVPDLRRFRRRPGRPRYQRRTRRGQDGRFFPRRRRSADRVSARGDDRIRHPFLPGDNPLRVAV